MNAKLTAKETALLTAIAENKVDFFEDGLVEGSNGWSDVLTDQLVGIVAETAKGVSAVAKSLHRKGLLESDFNTEDGESYFITAAGEAWFAENFPKAEEALVVEQAGPSADPEVENHIGYDVSTWQEEDHDLLAIEWIETTFADGSKTLRPRKQVNGAWRTDFWGFTAEGKKVSTTSKAAKAAREAGTFTI